MIFDKMFGRFVFKFEVLYSACAFETLKAFGSDYVCVLLLVFLCTLLHTAKLFLSLVVPLVVFAFVSNVYGVYIYADGNIF